MNLGPYYVMPVCRERDPEAIAVGEGRQVACHLHDPAVSPGPPPGGA